MADDLLPLPTLAPGRYRHYKGGDYEVLGVVRHSETLEPLVLYRPLYGERGDWVRPYAMFTGTVTIDGITRPRFERLGGTGRPVMRLHIANKVYSSWSLRPWVLLHELGVPFEEVLTPFGSNAGFGAFSPTGLVPCLVDDGDTVWDSLAIVEHLAERAPGVWPRDRAARSWARSATAEMHAGFGLLRELCSFNCTLRVRLNPLPPDAQARLDAQWARVDALWCEGLQRFGGPFLAGEAFTAVDAFHAPLAVRLQTYGITLSPAAQAYAERLLQRGSLKRWQAEACAEPWHDAPHDAELRARATVLLDERAPNASPPPESP